MRSAVTVCQTSLAVLRRGLLTPGCFVFVVTRATGLVRMPVMVNGPMMMLALLVVERDVKHRQQIETEKPEAAR